MKHKDIETFNKLEELILTCQEENIELAMTLAKGQQYPFEEELYLKHKDLIDFIRVTQYTMFTGKPALTIEASYYKEKNDNMINVSSIGALAILKEVSELFINNERNIVSKDLYIPPSLFDFAKLRTIYIENINLPTLPPTIENHPLNYITLKDTNIKTIPKTINNINLKGIRIFQKNTPDNLLDAFEANGKIKIINLSENIVTRELKTKLSEEYSYKTLDIWYSKDEKYIKFFKTFKNTINQ